MFSPMALYGRAVHFDSAAFIRQLLELFIIWLMKPLMERSKQYS
jgi:hypothetical protein